MQTGTNLLLNLKSRENVLLCFFDKIHVYFFRLALKENLLLLKIQKCREDACIAIQKDLRRFIQRKEILKYYEKKKQFYEIPFSEVIEGEETKNIEIYLVILSPSTYRNKYLLQYCKFRNLYVAHLPKDKFNVINVKKIYFKFRMSGKDCIDPNYEINSNPQKGFYCNKLDLRNYENLEKNLKLHLRKKTCEYMKWECDKYHRKITLSKNRHTGNSKSRHKDYKKLEITKQRKKLLDSNEKKSLFNKSFNTYHIDQDRIEDRIEKELDKRVNFSPLVKFKYYTRDPEDFQNKNKSFNSQKNDDEDFTCQSKKTILI